MKPTFIPKIMKTKAPQRHTPPRSRWRDLMNRMKPGQWFEFPASKRWTVLKAANNYTRGRYAAYQHPKKPGMYIYLRIK